MSTIAISITLELETLKKLDVQRGLAKRSSIINKLISDYLKKEKRSHGTPISGSTKRQSAKKGVGL